MSSAENNTASPELRRTVSTDRGKISTGFFREDSSTLTLHDATSGIRNVRTTDRANPSKEYSLKDSLGGDVTFKMFEREFRSKIQGRETSGYAELKLPLLDLFNQAPPEEQLEIYKRLRLAASDRLSEETHLKDMDDEDEANIRIFLQRSVTSSQDISPEEVWMVMDILYPLSKVENRLKSAHIEDASNAETLQGKNKEFYEGLTDISKQLYDMSRVIFGTEKGLKRTADVDLRVVQALKDFLLPKSELMKRIRLEVAARNSKKVPNTDTHYRELLDKIASNTNLESIDPVTALRERKQNERRAILNVFGVKTENGDMLGKDALPELVEQVKNQIHQGFDKNSIMDRNFRRTYSLLVNKDEGLGLDLTKEQIGWIKEFLDPMYIANVEQIRFKQRRGEALTPKEVQDLKDHPDTDTLLQEYLQINKDNNPDYEVIKGILKNGRRVARAIGKLAADPNLQDQFGDISQLRLSGDVLDMALLGLEFEERHSNLKEVTEDTLKAEAVFSTAPPTVPLPEDPDELISKQSVKSHPDSSPEEKKNQELQQQLIQLTKRLTNRAIVREKQKNVSPPAPVLEEVPVEEPPATVETPEELTEVPQQGTEEEPQSNSEELPPENPEIEEENIAPPKASKSEKFSNWLQEANAELSKTNVAESENEIKLPSFLQTTSTEPFSGFKNREVVPWVPEPRTLPLRDLKDRLLKRTQQARSAASSFMKGAIDKAASKINTSSSSESSPRESHTTEGLEVPPSWLAAAPAPIVEQTPNADEAYKGLSELLTGLSYTNEQNRPIEVEPEESAMIGKWKSESALIVKEAPFIDWEGEWRLHYKLNSTLGDWLRSENPSEVNEALKTIDKLVSLDIEKKDEEVLVRVSMQTVMNLIREWDPNNKTMVAREKILNHLADENSVLYKATLGLLNGENNIFSRTDFLSTLRMMAKNEYEPVYTPMLKFLGNEDTLPVLVTLMKSDVTSEESEDLMQTYTEVASFFSSKHEVVEYLLNLMENPKTSEKAAEILTKDKDLLDQLVEGIKQYYRGVFSLRQQSETHQDYSAKELSFGFITYSTANALSRSRQLLEKLNPAWETGNNV